jgi:hypothetical protein
LLIASRSLFRISEASASAGGISVSFCDDHEVTAPAASYSAFSRALPCASGE